MLVAIATRSKILKAQLKSPKNNIYTSNLKKRLGHIIVRISDLKKMQKPNVHFFTKLRLTPTLTVARSWLTPVVKDDL